MQVFPNSVLYKDGEELTALEKGKVQIIAPTNSKLSMLIVEFQALYLPYVFDNTDQVHQSLEGQIGRKLTTLLNNDNMYTDNMYTLAFWEFKSIIGHDLIEVADGLRNLSKKHKGGYKEKTLS